MSSNNLILVVSTEPVERDFIRSILQFRGYTAAVASPGFHMLSAICSSRPELVIFDARDFWREAVDLVAKIRELSPDSRILVLRAKANWTQFFEAVDAGASDLLPKPYSTPKLLSAMSLVMGELPA